MKLLADEDVDGPIVYRLRKDGHEVDYVAEMQPGILDEDLLTHANRNQALLLTADKISVNSYSARANSIAASY